MKKSYAGLSGLAGLAASVLLSALCLTACGGSTAPATMAPSSGAGRSAGTDTAAAGKEAGSDASEGTGEAAEGGSASDRDKEAGQSSPEETEMEESTPGGLEGGSELTLTTGDEQGTYYSFGSVLADKVNETTGTTMAYMASGGSASNVVALDMGDAELGFVQSDIMSYAYEGRRLFEETAPIRSFSTVAALYKEQIQIVTLDPEIRTVSDLAGKNVSIGAPGSGAYFNAIDILEAYGLREDSVEPSYFSYTKSVRELRDGTIDAAFIVAGVPTAAVAELAESGPLYLVGIDEEHIGMLTEVSPFYSGDEIPKEVYGTDVDTPTLAVDAVIIARNDVSDADVYNFLYGVFDHADEIAAVHPKGRLLNLDFAAGVRSVPYHPGARRFFEERGLKVP